MQVPALEFLVNNRYYQQILGAPMGFCVSPWLAEITLEIIETNSLNWLGNDVILYGRYVDDCLFIAHKNKIDDIIKTFNNQDNYLKFTMEKEQDSSIHYLYITIKRVKN